MWMQGVDLSAQVRASHDLICLDRGYMGPSLIAFLLNAGFTVLGTHKRVNSFPYTFGEARNRHTSKVIEEKGCKSLYVAKKKFGDQHLFAVAYRSGKGRVATLVCSEPRLGEIALHYGSFIEIGLRRLDLQAKSNADTDIVWTRT
jgi:hypothetical protein